MGVPQWIITVYLALAVIEYVIQAERKGKDGWVSAFSALLAVTLFAGVLYWGGFYG